MSRRSWMGLAAVVTGGVVLIPAAAAWACLSLASLNVNPTSAQPGGQVTVVGVEFYGKNPVSIHMGSLTGPVLATVTPDKSGRFSQAVTLPADAAAGPNVLIATEPAATATGPTGGSSAGVPARAVVDVTGPGGAPLAPAGTGTGTLPTGLLTSGSTISTASLVLAALGALGVGLFLAGGLALVVGRRRHPAAQAVRDN